jgi:hypothetical protein
LDFRLGRCLEFLSIHLDKKSSLPGLLASAHVMAEIDLSLALRASLSVGIGLNGYSFLMLGLGAGACGSVCGVFEAPGMH